VAPKQVARVLPTPHPVLEPVVPQFGLNSAPRNPPAQVIPVIDLSDENMVPYNDYFNPYDPVEEATDLEPPPQRIDREIINLEPSEIINLEPPSLVNSNDEIQTNDILLEPLDPDTEYQQNIHRMFITLDEYARNVYLNTHN